MLQLSRRAARHFVTCHTCPTCLTSSRRPPGSALRSTSIIAIRGQWVRYLSSTNTTQDTPATASAESSAPSTTNSSTSPQSKLEKDVAGKSPKAKPAAKSTPSKAAKNVKKPKTGGKAVAKPERSGEKPNNDSQRQLDVLQGALSALKKVLASHDIKVDDALDAPTKGGSKKLPKKKTKKTISDFTPGSKKEKPVPVDSDQGTKDESSPDVQEAGAEEPTRFQTQSFTHKARSGKKISKKEQKSQKAKAGKSYTDSLTTELDTRMKEKTEASSETILKTAAKAAKAAKEPNVKVRKLKSKPKSKKEEDPDFISRPKLQIQTLRAEGPELVPIEKPQPPVPSVSYGLDRVLFNPGVYHLQDPRSRVYNFDPYLSKIMPIQEFDFTALKQYVTSSKDETLIATARENNSKYTGSTSSMTSMLSHFHYLLSAWRPINSEMMSQGYDLPPGATQFTRVMRVPSATFLHYKDGVYAIDADKEFDSANILSMLGKSMEKLLTLPKEEYERYRHINSDQISEEERNAAEAFHYTSFGDFMMRSQLDAYDPRIPGTGMFDLKTRAVVSIRMDAQGFQKGLGYEIRKRHGQWESFEREYHDMIRAAFLKYSLQVRMGRMDGIFVAFHNTQRIFGFQYIPLTEMDLGLHGTDDRSLGDKEFKHSLSLLNELFDRATQNFPEQSLRFHFETRPSAKAPFMYVFARPVEPGEIEAVQNAGKAQVEAYEREILGIGKDSSADDQYGREEDNNADQTAANEEAVEKDTVDKDGPLSPEEGKTSTTWEEIRLMVDDAMEDDEVGIGAVREAIEDALEESGLLRAVNVREYVEVLLNAVTDGQAASASETEISEVASDTEENSEVDNGDAGPASTHEEQDNADVDASEESVTIQKETKTSELAEDQSGEHHSNASSDPSSAESLVDSQAETNQVSKSESLPESEEAPKWSDVVQPATSEDVFDTVEVLVEEDSRTRTDVMQTATFEEVSETDNVNASSHEAEKSSSTEEIDEEQETENENEELETEIEEDSKEDDSASASMLTLRNLIKQIVGKVDKERLARAAQDANDSSRLREFEHILEDMIAQSKADATQSDSVEKDSAAADPSDGSASTPPGEVPSEPGYTGPLLGMVLTIRNRVNGDYVSRPKKLRPSDAWEVEYNIEEMDSGQAKTLYERCIARRRKTMSDVNNKDDESWYTMWRGDLDKYTKAGRSFRAKDTREAKKRPVYVVGKEDSKTHEEVFGIEEDQDVAEQGQQDRSDEGG